MTEAAKVGFTEDPYSPGVWVNQSDFTSYSVMIFDPQDNTYTDATPADMSHRCTRLADTKGRPFLRPRWLRHIPAIGGNNKFMAALLLLPTERDGGLKWQLSLKMTSPAAGTFLPMP